MIYLILELLALAILIALFRADKKEAKKVFKNK